MDRIEFFQSVDQKNRAYDSVIASLFDQFSALYDIVAQYKYDKIINNTEKNKVQFDINCSNSTDANYILSQINSKSKQIVVYGSYFTISANKKADNIVQVKFFGSSQNSLY